MTNQNSAMESKLRQLLESNSEENRANYAVKTKEAGKPVLGMLCHYIPEEIIYAAGILPYRVTGTWRTNIMRASAYLTINSCHYCIHVLESFMSGELDFLDGVVATNFDDDVRRLHDIMIHVRKGSLFAPMVYLPRAESELGHRIFRKWVSRLIPSIEDRFGIRVSEESLRQAIAVYNETRTLLAKVYELRKRKQPPLSGAETLKLVTASFVMPKDEYNRQLGELIDYLENVRKVDRPVGKRLFVWSERLFHPGYIELIEECGATVVMDDMDTGSKYFWGKVDTTIDNPVDALVDYYLARCPCTRMFFWERHVPQMIDWIRDWSVDGVVSFPQVFSFHQLASVPYFEQQLSEAGIPVITTERDYPLVNEGQLRTRIQAFLEMLS